MSETRLHPQPDELWRTYDMTPFGPGAISSLVRVVDVAPNRQVGQDIVRYQGVHPEEADGIDWLPLGRFVNRHAAPYESEEDWMRRRIAGPARPDEEPTTDKETRS